MMHRLNAFVGIRTVTALLVVLLASSACGPAAEEVELLEQDQAHEIGSGSEPPVAGPLSPRYSEKFLVMDGADNTMTLGIDPVPDASRGHAVYANRYSPTTGWEPARRITTLYSDPVPTPGYTPLSAALLTQPIHLVGDRTGNAAVIYYESGTGAYRMTRFTPGLGWSAALTVPTAGGRAVRFHSVGFDGAGNVVAIGTGSYSGVSKHSWTRYRAPSGWDAPQLSDALESNVTTASAGRDDAGNAMIVELEKATTATEATSALRSRRYVVGSGWAPPEPLRNAGNAGVYGVQLASDSAGNFLAVWADAAAIMSRRYVAGTGWAAPVQITSNGLYPSVAMDRAGNALVAWEPGPGYVSTWVKGRRYKAGGAWGDVKKVSSQTYVSLGANWWRLGDAGEPAIAADTAGNLTVAWSNEDWVNGQRSYSVRARRLNASGTWADERTATLGSGDPRLSFGLVAGGPLSVHLFCRPIDQTDPLTLHRFVPNKGWQSPETVTWLLDPAAPPVRPAEPQSRPSAMIAFATSHAYRGNLGGIAGANAKCRAAADAGGFPGSFKAWISTDKISATQNIAHAHSLPFVRVDGQQVASSWADLADGTIAANINVSEMGGAPGSPNVWTGTEANGTYTGPSCANWTVGDWGSSSDEDGVDGYNSYYLNVSWTKTGSPSHCWEQSSLYCIQER